MKIQDKYKKDIVHTRVYEKPFVRIGIIEELLCCLRDRLEPSDRLEEFRIKGEKGARVKWFVL